MCAAPQPLQCFPTVLGPKFWLLQRLGMTVCRRWLAPCTRCSSGLRHPACLGCCGGASSSLPQPPPRPVCMNILYLHLVPSRPPSFLHLRVSRALPHLLPYLIVCHLFLCCFLSSIECNLCFFIALNPWSAPLPPLEWMFPPRPEDSMSCSLMFSVTSLISSVN